jgi:hypothetical protein
MNDHVISVKLGEVRRKHRGVTATGGLAMVGSCVIAAAAGEMFIDWLIDLPWLARAVLLAGMAAGLMYLGLKHLARPLLRGPDDDELALAVEREHPRLRGRLIASVQLARPMAVPPGLSTVLVQATLLQAEVMAAELDFRQVIKTDAMKRRAWTGSAMLVAGLALFLWTLPASGVLARRMLLSNEPVPRKTSVIPVTTSQRVAMGDDIALLADAGGIRPGGGTIEIHYSNNAVQQLAIGPIADTRSRYGTTLKNVQASFKFRITLGDGVGEWYDITVLPRPTVTGIAFWQVWPAYTHMPIQKRLGGDLSLLEGSRLIVAVTSSLPLEVPEPGNALSRVHLTGSAGDDRPLIVDGQAALAALPDISKADIPRADPGQGAATVAAGIALPSLTNGLSVTVVDTDGMESRDSVVYPITLVAPRAPLARILIQDHREQLVTLVATFDIPFDAVADYGLGGVSLVYRVDGGEEKTVPIEIPPGNPKEVKSTYTWQISSIEKSPSTTRPTLEGSTIEYWLRAIDTEPDPPLAGNGDHYQIRVVTPEEKRQELLMRAQVIPQVIRQTETHQESDNTNLGAIIMGGQTPATEPATQPAGGPP